MTDDPSIPSPAFEDMARRWALPKSLLGGTAVMQAMGTRFLPRHPAENETVYRERANRTVLRNYFGQTVRKLVGRVFAEPIRASSDMPDGIQNQFRNIDLMGRGLNVFAKAWFEDALVCGLSHVLVDFPTGGGGVGRPYAVHVPAENLIAARWHLNGSNHELVQVRIREGGREYHGNRERVVPQIRVLAPDHWTVWRQDEKGRWQCREEGENSLGRIPLVTLYTNRTGFMQAAPPLEDLAYLNLEHYQIRSDQRNALNVASFPILAAAGYDPELDGPIEVGPNKVLTTSDTDGKYYYVESTGAALEAGARELAHLEKAMQMFGLQFEAGAIGETATGRALDARDALSPLIGMAQELEDSLNLMLALFGSWSGLEAVGRLSVSADPLKGGAGGTDVGHLLSLRQMGEITPETLQAELAVRGIFKSASSFNDAGSLSG
ncbi:DUF4055 domain-containing protein [Sneathiella chinensis]|uniref:DUF4055 domain-containing protein n=1 Tax=Sneathiella chinensis TaxID=349750 RepID=A0ABQ5U8J4_9PROT|nr:DUF4055 domain-containing protein [Sneathiella chinensis]GLQ07518.1 hypothetical protein GCM10007924_27390 [Sneathiella chinensis]